MKKPDWNIFYIPCSGPCYRTEGLDRHGSLELELNLPLVPKQAAVFMNLIASQIAWHGKTYQSGDRVEDIFNLPFYLFQTTSVPSPLHSAPVLRILFCDEQLRYPWEDGCAEPYAQQLNDEERLRLRALLATKRRQAQ